MRLRAAILHASEAYRRGLADALTTTGLTVDEPGDCRHWVREPGRRVLIVDVGGDVGALPRPGADAVLVALLSGTDPEAVREALVAGAHGVVDVHAPPELIADVAKAAAEGEVRLAREVARRLAGPKPLSRDSLVLSDREVGWLQHLAQGGTISALAQGEFISVRTLYRRLQNLFVRLGVANRAQAIARAAELGAIPPLPARKGVDNSGKDDHQPR